MSKHKTVKNLTLSAMFIALGMILPFLTGQIPYVGQMLLPLHFPVLLCGFICGAGWGTLVGFVLPLLRMAMFGMPPLMTAIAMAFELATYGFVAGYLYSHSRWKCLVSLYRCLIAAMLAGRVVWALVEVMLFGLQGQTFTWQMFLAGAFSTALPGIILQLIVIPGIMLALGKSGLVPFTAARPAAAKS